MGHAPSTVQRLIDAYQDILVSDGERSATLEAIAQRAGVSKGGLTYHFKSKDELAAALFDRLQSLVEADLAVMRAEPAQAADYYVKSSLDVESPLERCNMAVTRLAQGSHPEANELLARCRTQWFDVLMDAVGNEDMVHLVMLLGDGIYFNASLTGTGAMPSETDPATIDRIVGLIGTIEY
ncbi:TetR/AcrR family transcriptional regulator [Nesterenkonia sp. LB17]|uniref:TetR/AcrR family transcriptional regulator n=1 Tax=unclassified Nesterenkonia TaxID=2629769 RepID=UPI001F4D0247|nr:MULTISPECIES: TetR/AcrR family transcriptional regulator [unclassified Nesterenkonia]MCH8559155.1 TetR/AcrR family transcriptional regulator [Nesterenkonia sp. DZ6]MCH8563068.1 TetR/AcrR family transcriptional regulator [Nesterenkonia sp. YGD6]MCH8565116.1 TetR/AcrR family transcriptional regulator [Nesterenkonia sp. LB17]